MLPFQRKTNPLKKRERGKGVAMKNNKFLLSQNWGMMKKKEKKSSDTLSLKIRGYFGGKA